jgi:hypothetical protein
VDVMERLHYNAQAMDAQKDAALTASRDVSETQQADCFCSGYGCTDEECTVVSRTLLPRNSFAAEFSQLKQP